jgi:hypothetical protein
MAVLLASLPCLPSAAQCDPVETAKIVPFDGVSGDLFFGDSVAVEGDVAVVGAPQDDTMGADAGAAYVYHHDGSDWTYETISVPGETFLTLFTSALHHPCHPPDESRFAKKVDNVSPGTDAAGWWGFQD